MARLMRLLSLTRLTWLTGGTGKRTSIVLTNASGTPFITADGKLLVRGTR